MTTVQNKALVSVIVPTYNRSHCLARTIQSVLDQTLSDWELIIVDNHSSDGTDDLVASYSDLRIKYLKIHNDGVVAASRNKGIQAASGKYLAFLDSDDWWAPKKLEKSVEALNAGADLVYHDLYLVSSGSLKPDFLKKRARTRQLRTPVFDDLIFNGNTIFNSSVVVRRELMESIGGFSEDKELIAAEDFDAWLRISKLSDAFARLPACLGYYMIGADNLSSSGRTIFTVNHIMRLYREEVQEKFKGIPGWVNYSLASSYYKAGVYDKSKLHALDTIKRHSSINFKIRAILILTLILVNRFFINKH